MTRRHLSDYLELRHCVIEGIGKPTDILIKDGKITSIGKAPGNEPFVDCRGLPVIPGAIDGHVHYRGTTDEEQLKETWECGVQAAIAGGVTTVCDMPNHPGDFAVTTLERYYAKQERIGTRDIGYKLWFAATKDNWRQFRHLNDPACAGIKLYMEETTGGLYVASYSDQRAICHAAAEAGKVLAVHVGDQKMLEKSTRRYRRPTVADHCDIRSTAVELSGVRTILRAAKTAVGCKLHICHVSCPEVVREILAAQATGLEVSFEVCPHHFWYTKEMLATDRGAWFKMNPPLRSPEQMQAMREYLTDGVPTSIATDHAPHTNKEKKRKDYTAIPSGVPGVQEMLPLCLTLVAQGVMKLDDVIAMTSRNPARLFGFPDKGALKEGRDADVVVFDPAEEGVLSNKTSHSRCGWTAYDGVKTQGGIKVVIAGGKVLQNTLN